MANLPPLPLRSILTNVRTWLLSDDWARWLQALKDRADAAAVRVGSAVALVAQAASIGATAVPTPTLSGGLYRVSWVARVTQAATTSSSLAVTIGATVDGVPTAQSGPALTANAVGAVQSGSVVVEVEAGTAITYATTYASVGATPMRYALNVFAEAIA